MDKLKGWRTIALGLIMAVAPTGLTYLAGVDWTSLVGPNVAMAFGGAIMIGMRIITSTPVGSSSPPPFPKVPTTAAAVQRQIDAQRAMDANKP